MEIALDQCGPATERRLAIVDKNRDLYVTSVRVFGGERKTHKLGKESKCNMSITYSLYVKILIYRGFFLPSS